jgi:hypothetical protein
MQLDKTYELAAEAKWYPIWQQRVLETWRTLHGAYPEGLPLSWTKRNLTSLSSAK